MNLTGNQAVNLLWSHYCDLSSPLELTEAEVTHLELEIVAQWDSLEKESPYVKQIAYDTKESFIGFLLNNPSKSIFQRQTKWQY